VWVVCGACVMLAAHTAWAQSDLSATEVEPPAASPPSLDEPSEEPDGSSRRTERGVTPLVAPVPFKNTQIGWGLMLMGGVIHRFDADTTLKPSTGMVGGFASENGSWGVMAMEMARFSRDTWSHGQVTPRVEVA